MMSVKKCGGNYDLFRPLIQNWVNENPEGWQDQVRDTFENAEDIIQEILSGANPSPAVPVDIEEDIVRESREESPQSITNDTILNLYSEKGRRSTELLLNNFVRDMVSMCILKVDGSRKRTVNLGDTEEEVTENLNSAIREYKKERINIIKDYVQGIGWKGEGLSEENEIESVITYFESKCIGTDKSSKFEEAYEAYIQAVKFDDLIAKKAPFISINKKYILDNPYTSTRRYSLATLTTKQFQSFSTNEYMDAADAMSDIAKSILSGIPEVNESKIDLPTMVGYRGWMSAMSKLKLAIDDDVLDLSINGKRVSAMSENEICSNMQSIITAFIKYLTESENVNTSHVTYLVDKLRGLQKYLFSERVPEHFRQMFTHMMLKTVPSAYVSYVMSDESSKVQHITERPIMLQQKFLNDAVLGNTVYLLNNKGILDSLYTKYGIKKSSDGGFSIAYTTQDGINLTINFNKSRGGVWQFDNNDWLDDNIETFVTDFLQMIIPSELMDHKFISRYTNKTSVHATARLYMPLIASVISDTLYDTRTGVAFPDSRDLAKMLSVINGSETISVIKNEQGNAMPLYQMQCLAYNHRLMANHINDHVITSNDPSPLYHNLVCKNINKIKHPKIRTEVKKEIKGKLPVVESTATLDPQSLLHLAIGYDFLMPLLGNVSDEEESKSVVVGFQTHCYSDKTKHFIMQFDITEGWDGMESLNASELREYIKGTSEFSDVTNNILNDWRVSTLAQLNTQIAKIQKDYQDAGADPTKSYAEIKLKFKAAGIDFIEEFHGSIYKDEKGIKRVRPNETLQYLHEVFSDDAKFYAFIDSQKEQFLADSENARTKLRDDSAINNLFKSLGVADTEVANVRERAIDAFFVLDLVLSNEYNKMMVGDAMWHATKSKSADSAVVMASRWISQVKRMVIYGATSHTFAQGLKYGVPEEANMCVIEDIPAAVRNLTGNQTNIDSADGAGYVSPYFSMMENASLLEAAVKGPKKTIWHDMHVTTGTPKLLKWAEYELSPYYRRCSKGSKYSAEALFRKMHSIPFEPGTTINYSKSFKDDPLYVQDPETGQIRQITYIEFINNSDGIKARITYADSSNPEFKSINTIYDIDQVFGGAWSGNFVNGKMIWNDVAQNETFKIICDNNLKDKMIHIAANKSACKVGVTNLNSVNVWSDSPNSEELWHTKISTKFAGLQMDAEHTLDDATVTEPTQMISALEQMGNSHETVKEIYTELGQYCASQLAEINECLKLVGEDKHDALLQIFGKALIDSFRQNDRETLGLAQAFLVNTKKSMIDNHITYQIPFSSSSINGIFNATVISDIVKKGIRRKFDGIASVLNPSYGLVQYYEIDGQKLNYAQVVNWFAEQQKSGAIAPGITLSQYLDWRAIDEDGNISVNVDNPLIKVASDENPADFGDSVIMYNGTEWVEDIIDSRAKYILYRNLPKGEILYINNCRPKELKGADTQFVASRTEGNNVITKRFSAFDDPISILLYYLKDTASTDVKSLRSEIEYKIARELGVTVENPKVGAVFSTFYSTFSEEVNPSGEAKLHTVSVNTDELRLSLVKRLHSNLANLKTGTLISFDRITSYKIDSVKTNPAQIVMGTRYAKRLGIEKGTSISEIRNKGWKYFRDRLNSLFRPKNTEYESYDAALYNEDGKCLYVYVGEPNFKEDPTKFISKSSFENVNGRIYHGDQEICSADRKHFGTYVDAQGEQHEYCWVETKEDLQELLKSSWTEHHEMSITEHYYRAVMDGKEEWTNDLRIKLSSPERLRISNHINHLASARQIAFEESLKMIGTRIPCQNMTSFSAMEVIMWSEDDINNVYIPANICWLEGSDFDIDKQYLIGYSVEKSGRLVKDQYKPWQAQNALRNRLVDKIWSVVTDPSNQINLTEPVTTEHAGELAKESALGQLATRMNQFSPFYKYAMQIENMVGKTGIGSVATGIKSFFALSYTYNEEVSRMTSAIYAGEWEVVNSILNSLPKLSNLKVDGIIAAMSKMADQMPDDLKDNLAMYIAFQNSLDDQSLLLGELLNCATDNAKELILKKINADSGWIDFYTVLFLEGYSFADCKKLLMNEEVNELVEESEGNPYGYLQKYILDELKSTGMKSSAARKVLFKEIQKLKIIGPEIINAFRAGDELYLNELLKNFKLANILSPANIVIFTMALNAKELQTMGRILKINQGIPTNFAEFYAYISNINSYFTNLSEQLGEKESFDYLRFLSDENYRNECANNPNFQFKYNPLKVLVESPHFNAMATTMVTANDILTTLSVRNKLRELVYKQAEKNISFSASDFNTGETYTEYFSIGPASSEDAFRFLDSKIDEYLINKFISGLRIEFVLDKGQSFVDPNFNVATLIAPQKCVLDKDNLPNFRHFIEGKFIPWLKSKYGNNSFVGNLVLGYKNDEPYYRLPINMMDIDSSEGTKAKFEEYAKGFEELRGLKYKVGDKSIEIVDLFYLYNMIVNKDHFGQTSLTRLFDEIITSDPDKKYLVSKFSEWIDQQNPQALFEEMPVIDPADNLWNISMVPKKEDGWNFGVENQYINDFVISTAKKVGVTPGKFYTQFEKMMPYITNYNYIEFEVVDHGTVIKTISVKDISQIIEGNQTAIISNSTSYLGKAYENLKEGDIIRLKSGAGSVLVRITKPYGRLIKNSELSKFNAQKVEPVEIPRISPDKITLHSGAADGADTDWSIIAVQYGVKKHNHYVDSQKTKDTKKYDFPLIFEDYTQYIPEMERIISEYKIGNVEKLRSSEYKGSIYRSYIQALYAKAIYAICPINPTYKRPDGGTRYAIYAAIDMGKPVYVWDTNTERW